MFKDLTEYLTDTLDLPINGKVYRVPPVDAQTGLKLKRIQLLGQAAANGAELSEEQLAELQMDDEEQRSLYQKLLGPVYDEMLEDGVSWPHLERAGNTAIAFFVGGREMAEKAWTEAPKAPARSSRQRRSKTT